MAEFPDERQLVLRARSQLDQWTRSARMEAYTELFESDDSILSPKEVQLLDALDSELEREGGDGVWGSDQYGIHTAGTSSSDISLGVVCVYHPQITKDSVLRGADELDDEAEERLNAALWQYSERVATLIEEKLHEFTRQTQS
ncbi:MULTISPECIES: hypothetical protein [unclassified Haloferax]|uniref:DUF7539 family protein n=1 Tax=unclassified Haloferax TaxID=2625095 RepID=UPI000E225B1B|nr:MULTISPECIES: hypothetical protein [unclassified Haloferax]RDZ33930.1 hypothetical protein C5B88_14740 [Haloferax sp. Atlit-24N]RLM33535.1 hypothetical protein DVK03_17805 [Haloferax sp. Atlit-109R]RLM40887.1 hypothetical protein DVK04_18515 [Haloferax sp. Atlit-105R]